MYTRLSHEMVRQETERLHEAAQRQRLQALARRARRRRGRERRRALAARLLFAAAFALDERESWRAVWNLMSPPDEGKEERI